MMVFQVELAVSMAEEAALADWIFAATVAVWACLASKADLRAMCARRDCFSWVVLRVVAIEWIMERWRTRCSWRKR